MGFTQKLTDTVKRHMVNLKAAHDKRVIEAEARARVRLATARTSTEREKAKLILEREKLALKMDLYEAQIATRKAKAAVNKARLEAGDLTIGERIGAVGSSLGREAKSAYKALEKRSRPTRKRVVRKAAGKVVSRKTVTGKRKTTR